MQRHLDYFKQRRAYRQFKIYEADVSTGQNNLYRELLDYANDEGKLDNEFPVKNSALLSLTGLSESGLKKARNELVQLRLINYIKGRKNSRAPQYKIVNLYQKLKFMVPVWDTRKENSVPDRADKGTQKGTLVGTQTVAHKELTSTDLDSTNTDKTSTSGNVPASKSHDEVQGKRQAVFDFWNNNGFGIMPPLVYEHIGHEINDFDVDGVSESEGYALIKYALQVSVDNNARSWAYTSAVLRRMHQQKIMSVEQAEAAAKKREADKSQPYVPKWRQRTPVQKETLPDWAKSDYEVTDTMADTKTQQEFNERLAKLRSKRSS